MSDDLDRCKRTLWAIAPDHNLYRTRQYKAPHYGYEPCGDGVRILLQSTVLSTYDSNALTRLVIAAHRNRVRIAISPKSQLSIEITAHPRQSNGDLYSRHPGMEALSDNGDPSER